MKLLSFCIVLFFAVEYVAAASPSTSSSSASTSSTPYPSSCCPNGLYTDPNISLAGNSPDIPNYGDGQCYQDYQIQCRAYYAGGAASLSPVEDNLLDCLNLCTTFETNSHQITFSRSGFGLFLN
jgi:hypothetical protein